jgi:hypothetical protein
MKQSSFLRLAFLLFFAVALSGSVAAQSKDRDHPTPVKSNEINGELDASGDEYFYSFLAGPGELTITVDVKSSGGTAGINFELLEKNAATAIICCEFAQADSSDQSGRDVKSAKFRVRQRVILHLTQFKYGKGTYRVRLSGAVADEK